ncbi:hypothetical protein HDG40_005666 [Paraburkholderia sp. JPY158]|uniref:Uncharacterized protein n=1 Tax=Paraburkholderia atlantica TaxID=2654982 RepID=A0A7W8QBQ7_PARAM|nr:hypothetical protein [Paraburkholderia atlantica]MBB5427487.1 hypothetical protein [Paraburkholderia atlantica]
MLKVTVELWPGGREAGKQVIATADIVRVRDGARADYEVALKEGLLGSVGDVAFVCSYPRWSASVWDLVGRSISAALSGGKEELPPRPVLPEVPVHVIDGMRCVRLADIPEPTRTLFAHNLAGSSVPGHNLAFAWDFEDFMLGQR